MNPIALIVGILFALLGGIRYLVKKRDFQRQNSIANGGKTILDSRQNGILFAQLIVRPNEILKSPLAEKDCVYWTKVRQQVGQRGWHTQSRESRGVAFNLTDETGSLLVDPSKIVIEIEGEKSFKQSEKKKDSTFGIFNQKFRDIEWVLEPEEKVTALLKLDYSKGNPEIDPSFPNKLSIRSPKDLLNIMDRAYDKSYTSAYSAILIGVVIFIYGLL